MGPSLLARAGRHLRQSAALSTVSNPSPVFVNAKRIDEANPSNHSVDHFGLFYTLPEKSKKQLFSLGGFPKSLEMNFETFGETCIMVRKPALEIIDFLKKADYTKPAIRYVIYGRPGCGKTLTMAHILHYAHTSNFYILHVPWVWNWFRSYRTEIVPSTTEGMFDLPLVSAHWLKHFNSQNETLLRSNEITIQNDYVWSPREATPAGSPLIDLVSHGINRVKYAGDAVRAIIKEMKGATRENKCKVLIAVDGFDALFRDKTNIKTDDKKPVKPEQISLTQAFMEATKQDWSNSAVVVTVDELATRHEATAESHLPLSLLGKKGFEHLDPFIPVEVKELSDLEVNSMLDYYEDRRWLVRPEGRNELIFLSNKNPYQLMKLVNGL